MCHERLLYDFIASNAFCCLESGDRKRVGVFLAPLAFQVVHVPGPGAPNSSRQWAARVAASLGHQKPLGDGTKKKVSAITAKVIQVNSNVH